jgi:arginine N-succinyltransferase
MFIIRPIKQNDLDQLMELLKESGHGLTSLPRDPEVIKKKIVFSERSFAHRAERGANGESYLFVMEELFTGKIVGVSGIISKIGGFEPYYFYRLKSEKFKSKMLKKETTIRSLHFEATHSGPAEICSLFLKPDFRNAQNGRFLSLSRFLFMAEDRKYFEEEVIAEMRGRVNNDGYSPFWEAVGRKFMDINFTEADYLTMKSKKFIDELVPKYPVIVELLPPEAQEVIAEVHPETVPARKILENEGFKFSGLVGMFEPGPVLIAPLDDIRAVKESKQLVVGEITKDRLSSEVDIISTSEKAFKSVLGKLEIMNDGKAKIEDATAIALELRIGDKIRYVSLKPEKK